MTIWTSWAADWNLRSKVEFDGINKIISVHPEVTEIDIRTDIYSGWVDWVAMRDHLKFKQAIRFTGLDVLGIGVYSGDTYFLMNGWKLSINLQKVKVTGVLYSDDYASAYYTEELKLQYPVSVSAIVNTLSTSIGSLVTAADIRKEIEDSTILAKETTLQSVKSTTELVLAQNGITDAQAQMLLEMYVILGLDPAQPLLVNETVKTAGTIRQTIDTNSTRTILTRQ